MMRHLMLRSLRYLLALGLIVAAAPSVLRATPYASNVVVTGGTSVSFILNEPSTSLSYTVNGGAPQTLDGSTKGTKTFSIPAGATFSIVADSTEATGYTIPTGTQIEAVPVVGCGPANSCTGLSLITNQSGTNVISDDTSSLSRYNSPRGVSVSLNPNSSNFGTAYINNSAAGTLTGGNVVGPNTAANVGRTLTGKGLYAVRADESDAFGNGDAAVNPTNIDTFPAFATAVNQYGTSTANSAYRIRVGDDGTIWASDYSDVNGQLFNIQPNLTGGATTSVNILKDFGGPPQPTAADGTTVLPTADGTGLGPDPGCAGALRGCTPTKQNHGSISSSWTTGSLAGGNLVVYTLDEDLNSAHFGTGANSQTDRNSVWQYNIGGSIPAGGYAANPDAQLTPGGANGLIGDFGPGGIVADMTRGPDGKFYLAQNRAGGNQAGILVFDSTGQNVLFNSLTASRSLLADPAGHDILTGIGGIDVSPDGKYLAAVLIDNDILIMPLVNGVPDLNTRMLVDGGTNGGNGRDISFDAADNLYYVSSGQGMYRVLSPGGHTTTTLTWNGTAYSFSSATAAAGIAGDYNNDGIVDMRDYVVWRNGDSPNPNSAADYNTWRTNFGSHAGAGSSLGGSAAVPEPGCLALVMVGLLAVGGCRKRLA